MPHHHGRGRSVGDTADACKINRIKERCAAWHRRGVVGQRKRTNVEQQQSGSATIPFGLVVWENDAPVSHFYPCAPATAGAQTGSSRSEEHTSELQSLMRISYAVFCLKQTNKHEHHTQYRILDNV